MKLQLKAWSMPILIVIIIFGGIAIAQWGGYWETTSEGGGGNGGGRGRGEVSESEVADYEPGDIRGSYTFDDVSSIFNIDPKILLSAFGLPTDLDPVSIRTGDLESYYEGSGVEVGNGSVKIFVGLYKDLPVDLDLDSYLPTSAVALIKAANSNLAVEQEAYLLSNKIDFIPVIE
ncbi:MAG: hypothetical protein PHC86_05455 [Eubacteriales bacterium]|nr:hypothetical protein [Eubacteriales bacterium]